MTMSRLLWIAAAFAVYWFFLRSGCGTRGAIACPPPALEEGVGVTLSAAEVCPTAGYLCYGRDSFQVIRWPLNQGSIRVRVPLPPIADAELAARLRQAATEGIMAWDRRPFPIIVDNSKFTLRVADIVVTWSQVIFSGTGGHASVKAFPDGKRMSYTIDELTIALVPRHIGGANVFALLGLAKVGPNQAAAWEQQIRATATHEMGHALGLMHSDSRYDIMYPEMSQDSSTVHLTGRDTQTVEALYKLPNGARVQ